MKCVEEQLLKASIDTILFGFGDLMDANRTEDLGRLYNLCCAPFLFNNFSVAVCVVKVNALDQLKASFIEYTKTKGTAIMMDEEHVRGVLAKEWSVVL